MDYTLEVSRSVWGRLQAVILLSLALFISLASPASAAAISQGYQAAGSLAPGTLVVQESNSNQVAAADVAHTPELLGVVVASGDTTLAVGTSGDDVQVVTSGSATVFVTDLNGAIKAGDMITASPIKGVGMKATAAGKVIGVAQAAAVTKSSQSVSVSTAGGGKVSAHLTSVPITVQSSYFTPAAAPTKSSTPQFLQVFANQVAGKPVALLRVTISTVILIVALCVVSVMLFSAVRGTMTALGRNPLAHQSIYRGLWQVLTTIIIIMIIGLIGSYVVLTR
ncbi:MAG TPA: hypothetical protein VMR75_01215 [Candidatus Saccharimonadales bacterium]|nr:hypothetical protein [Candidatus Saccharimonadales bacterium]